MSKIKVEDIQGRTSNHEGITLDNNSSVALKHTGDVKLQTDADGITLLGSVKETIYTISDASEVIIDPTNGTIQIWTIADGNRSINDNMASGTAMVLIVNPTTFDIDWGTSVKWPNGSEPNLSSTNVNIFDLLKVNNDLYVTLRGQYA